MDKRSIVIADWEPQLGDFLCAILEPHGFEVSLVYSRAEIGAALARRPDLAIALSVHPGGIFPREGQWDGKNIIEYFERLNKEWGDYSLDSFLREAAASGAAIIVATASLDERWESIVRRYPRARLLHKPVPAAFLLQNVNELLGAGARRSPDAARGRPA